MFKVNNKDTRCVFIVNVEYISHLALVFLLLTLNAGWEDNSMDQVWWEQLNESCCYDQKIALK